MRKQIFNKKAYTSRDYFIAMLFFGSAIALVALMVGGMATEYESDSIVDENFEEKYSQVEDYTAIIDSSLQAATEEGGLGIVGVTAILFTASFAFINLILSTLGLISLPTVSFVQDFSVPIQVSVIVFATAISIITITIVLRVLSTVTQRKF